MATQTDPVEALAAVVTRLYDLAGNAGVSAAQQQALLTQAHDLRGDLVALVELQLNASDNEYNAMMASLSSITTALNQAEQKIQNLAADVNALADITAAINNLLTQAIQLGTTAAALAAA